MQVRQYIVDLLIAQHISEAIHFVPSHANNVSCAVVIRRHAAGREVLTLEHALQTRPLAFAGRIRRMAAIAVLVINVPAGRLLRRESKFGVAAPPLHFASATDGEQDRAQA